MIRQAVILILIGFALTACIQNIAFDCKRYPNHPHCGK